jgi:chemotaxis protein CheX
MNVKYLLPFIEAAYEVLQAEVKCKMQRGELLLEKSHYVTNDLTVIVSMVGDIEGTVFYSMNNKTAMFISSAILGEQLEEMNSIAQSGVAELGNVITGRASVKLSSAGFNSNISPPTLLMGKGAVISTLDYTRLIVPLTGEPGEIIIHLALREGTRKGLSAPNISVPVAPLKK